MSLLSGINHAAIITKDLAALIAFYTTVFDAQVIFEETTPVLRHAMLRIGESVLHPAELRESPHATGSPAMFERGHLDHLGLTVKSKEAFEELRTRLVARGASDGMVSSIGPQLSFWFEDADGMHGEVCLISDPALCNFHSPKPVHRSAL